MRINLSIVLFHIGLVYHWKGSEWRAGQRQTIFIIGTTLSEDEICRGPNPNPGERTADMATLKGDFNKAFAIVKLAAEKGESWAHLRFGVFYENG